MIFNKTRIIGLLGMAVLAYLAGSANPMTTSDYPVYYNHYSNIVIEMFKGISPFEKGYSWMTYVFYIHGFTYAQFRLIASFITFALLFCGAICFTNNVALFTGLYGVTFFFNDATQFRNMMMISLIVLGAGMLAKESKIAKIAGLMFILLSTQFHSLGYIFALFIVVFNFIDFNKIKKYFSKYVAATFIIGAIIATFPEYLSNMLVKIILVVRGGTTSMDIAHMERYGRGNNIIYVFIMWMSLYFTYLLLKQFLEKHTQILNQNQIKLLMIGSSVAFLSSILFVIAPDYSRLSRNAYLFIILVACNLMNYGTTKFTKKAMKNFVIVLMAISLTTVVDNGIWGSTYLQSIPYLAQIKNSER